MQERRKVREGVTFVGVSPRQVYFVREQRAGGGGGGRAGGRSCGRRLPGCKLNP